MKKCPKCGTVLDDSKKKCYMCGADLQRASLTFGDSFDSSVGATVSKNQGNAFTNVPQSQGQPQPNPMAQISQQIQNVGGSVQNTNGFESGVFKNQMNSLNSMAYDDRSAIEKMFSSDTRFRSKAEINAQDAMMSNRNSFSTGVPDDMSSKDAIRKLQDVGNNPANVTPRGTPMNPMVQGNPFNNNNMTGANMVGGNNNPYNNGFNQPPMNQRPNNVMPQQQMAQQYANRQPMPQQQQQQQKPSINWGNNLVPNSGNSVSNYRDKTSKFNINFSFIFNTTCFVIFVIGFIFIYFKYIKVDNKNNVNDFGGLSYKINKNFTLKSNDKYDRLYTYGDNCAIRIQYGSTNDGNYYIESKFNEVKETYAGKYEALSEEIRINSNVWSSIKLVDIKEDAAGLGGVSTTERYKFVAIIYKGNYYTITYSNLIDDNICSSSYDAFQATLNFIED